MARPNVTFRINDESMVIPISENFSTTIGAVYFPNNNLKNLGNTGEQQQGYFLVTDISNWYARMSDYIVKLDGGLALSAGITAYTPGSCAASYLNGEYTGTGAGSGFSGEWWSVHNYLQYGGACYVGFGTGLAGLSAMYDLAFDVMFSGAPVGVTATNYNTAVTTVIDQKSSTDLPAIGVVTVPSSVDAVTTGYLTSNIPSGTSTKDYVRVYGEKIHLDTTGLYTVTTPLAPDVAGCIARTDRDNYPWFSPAGARRGRILNVLRLKRSVSPQEQDTLFDNGVNPVVTFTGEGTLLYGDKTGETATSTLSRINVSRLFMYIRKSLAPLARGILFEQNDSITRSRFTLAAESFLDRIQGQRGLTDYRVVCDETNNTPEVVEANYFVADILVKPITSINYIRITLTNKDLSSTLQ
jgi:hypothetical protein